LIGASIDETDFPEMNASENSVQVAPPSPASDLSLRAAETSAELKRGAFLNTIAMVVSNFRAIFILLIARLLGPIALGIFSVAWSITDLVSKVGILGLDDAITTFVARANASREHVRAAALFRVAAVLGVVQSTAVAVLAVFAIRLFGNRLGLEPEMASALAIILCALPGIALYRISTAVSRGMKVMKHDIYSRGVMESGATTLAFLITFAFGSTVFAPEIAAIAGTAASGIVAFALASRLFPFVPNQTEVVSHRDTARELLVYALPIGADQFLNAFIWRLDVIMLGWFVGRVPGVTLTTLGIYGAVVGVANGLRKVSQAFTPIFAPVVAGMTATGEHERARLTYARLAQWMLWILLPFVAVLALAGDTILLAFGSAFEDGSTWLTIVALACATNAFINLGETVIMVQRPGLNFLNSLITCALGGGATLWFISRFSVTGAAFGILTTYVIQGVVRNITLRLVFRWHNPWSNVAPPLAAALLALIPALVLRTLLHGIPGQISAAIVFLLVFGFAWNRQRLRFKMQAN
jgi:O-antigen/teichoic acid export membrane protein